jgi:glycosyltransferase involved in cell wall biosynthesis
LVIVDDGSNDGTAEAAGEWLRHAQPSFEWQVVRCPHRSAAAARCVGFEVIRELPLVAFLDSDDHWPSDFLNRATAALAVNPAAVAATADRDFKTPSGGPAEQEPDMRRMLADPIPWIFHHGAALASCTVLRTEAVSRVGCWKAELGAAEDSALFAAIASEGEWLHLPGAPVEFHVGSARARGEESNLTNRFDDRHLRWARVYEWIYKNVVPGKSDVNRRPLHDALAYRWYAAAKQLIKLGRTDEARDACSRALYWRYTFVSAWRLRLRLSVASRPQSSRAA